MPVTKQTMDKALELQTQKLNELSKKINEINRVIDVIKSDIKSLQITHSSPQSQIIGRRALEPLNKTVSNPESETTQTSNGNKNNLWDNTYTLTASDKKIAESRQADMERVKSDPAYRSYVLNLRLPLDQY